MSLRSFRVIFNDAREAGEYVAAYRMELDPTGAVVFYGAKGCSSCGADNEHPPTITRILAPGTWKDVMESSR